MSKIEPDAIILQTIEDHQPRLNQLVEVKVEGKSNREYITIFKMANL